MKIYLPVAEAMHVDVQRPSAEMDRSLVGRRDRPPPTMVTRSLYRPMSEPIDVAAATLLVTSAAEKTVASVENPGLGPEQGKKTLDEWG